MPRIPVITAERGPGVLQLPPVPQPARIYSGFEEIREFGETLGTIADRVKKQQDDLDYIDRLTEQSPYIRTDFQANLVSYGCGAAKEILYLTPYGDVLVCPFMHISFGNIFFKIIPVIS